MSTWERNQNTRFTDRQALGDSTLPLPERGNDVPDVLDEARWELEWMLTMQVPAGKPLAGMVHHKVHDHQWTGLPLDPAADDKVRELHRPSTAATLNLAAVAAQGARIFDAVRRGLRRRVARGRASRPGRPPTPTRRCTRRPPMATPVAARTTTPTSRTSSTGRRPSST